MLEPERVELGRYPLDARVVARARRVLGRDRDEIAREPDDRVAVWLEARQRPLT
jgi:hypothetical protein